MDTEMVLDMFSDDLTKARRFFKEFVCDRQDEERPPAHLGSNMSRHLKETEAIELIKRIGNVTHCTELAEKTESNAIRRLLC
jgi:uncharacterized tellurite resistance protein B-like protein